jgi:hypothetical protein
MGGTARTVRMQVEDAVKTYDVTDMSPRCNSRRRRPRRPPRFPDARRRAGTGGRRGTPQLRGRTRRSRI